jgi:hypothetical protein
VIGGPPPCVCSLGLNSGTVTFDSSCTGGAVVVTGNGRVTNNSTISSFSDYTAQSLVWDEQMADHQDPGSMGANQEHGVVSKV